MIRNIDLYFLMAFFFIFSFGLSFWVFNFLFFFQEQQSLFIFSAEYIHNYFLKPGGLLELAGNFLSQFYINSTIGSLILSLILTLPIAILFKINKRLNARNSFSLLFVLIPSSLLLLMQVQYNHLITYNVGFLLVILFFFLSMIIPTKKQNHFSLALLPIFYYIAGAYVWILLGIFIVHNLYQKKGKPHYYFPALFVIITFATIIFSKRILFLQPLDQLLRHPLPLIDNFEHRVFFYLLAGYLIFYPLLVKTSFLQKIKNKYFRLTSWISVMSVFILTIVFLYKLYNPEIEKVLQLQKAVFNKKWNAVIELHETSPSNNMIGQYFYNIALSETDQLCDRLFSGKQGYSTNSLILPWSNLHLNNGAYLYYSVGLINEAHRWAYESMVVNGHLPQNIKLLVKTNLINGNYRIAEKYIDIFKKTLFYKRWAEDYEMMLYEPELIQSHSELGEKIKLLPKENFFIQIESPQVNIALLLKANPDNRKAFEYKIAWFLLEKNVEELINHIQTIRLMGYTRIPRYIEEAILVYYNSTGNFPDLGEHKISNATELRFRQYIKAYTNIRQYPSLIEEQMRDNFDDTFWFYFHFK